MSRVGATHWAGPGSQAVPSSETRNDGLAWGGQGGGHGAGLAWDPVHSHLQREGKRVLGSRVELPVPSGHLPDSQVPNPQRKGWRKDGDAVSLSVCLSGVGLALDGLYGVFGALPLHRAQNA